MDVDIPGASSTSKTVVDLSWTSRRINLPTVSSRVGHGLIPFDGKVYLIGGGSEAGETKELWEVKLDLCSDDVKTKLLDVPTLPGIYEFASNQTEGSVWIFGGSDQKSTKNEIYVLDLKNNTCELRKTDPENKYDAPSPRTQFGNKCLVELDDMKRFLVVFGGGAEVENSVEDKHLYLYNMVSNRWRKLEPSGNGPSSRQGHVMASVGSKVYIHGGLSGTDLFDDTFLVDLSSESPAWIEVEPTVKPIARAAHNVAVIGSTVYIYGGLGPEGSALSDFWKFDTENLIWRQIHYTGTESPRLDFAMCAYSYNNSPGLLLHGGVDPGGQFFEDFLFLSGVEIETEPRSTT